MNLVKVWELDFFFFFFDKIDRSILIILKEYKECTRGGSH